MIGPASGGRTVKVLTGRTAASLQRYRDSVDEGKEAPLFTATRHCSHGASSQIAEWKAVREAHGTQGARRASRAAFEPVDPQTGVHAGGERGTHVRFHDGTRWRKRPVREGETPTHLKVGAGELVMREKESEATHTIYAFGADLVNPDDHEAMQRAFEAVVAERDELYPGLQESIWGERNGASGLFHVHVASNATVYRDFTLDGVDYAAGRKMAGTLTRVHDVRARSDAFLDAHPQHGFQQSLARVGTDAYAARQVRDRQRSYWEQTRGKESNQDRIRRTVLEALSANGVTDRATFVAEMTARGVDVAETGLRRGKPGKNHDYSYRVAGAKQSVTGKTLGVEYTHGAIGAQLELKALGRRIEQPAGAQRAGETCPLPFELKPLTSSEKYALDQLRADVATLAQHELAHQVAEQTRQPAVAAQPAHFADEALRRIRQWSNSSEFEAEFEQLRAEREQAGRPRAAQQPQAVATPAVEPGREPREHELARVPEPQRHDPEPVWRSRLRDLRVASTERRESLDRLADLEEQWHGALPSTPEERREFERQVRPLNIGRKALGQLEPHMDPEMHGVLSARAAKVGEHIAARKRAERLDNRMPTLQRRAAADPFDVRGDQGRLRDAEADLQFETECCDRLSEDLDAGLYHSRAHERAEHVKRKNASKVAELRPSAGKARQHNAASRASGLLAGEPAIHDIDRSNARAEEASR